MYTLHKPRSPPSPPPPPPISTTTTTTTTIILTTTSPLLSSSPPGHPPSLHHPPLLPPTTHAHAHLRNKANARRLFSANPRYTGFLPHTANREASRTRVAARFASPHYKPSFPTQQLLCFNHGYNHHYRLTHCRATKPSSYLLRVRLVLVHRPAHPSCRLIPVAPLRLTVPLRLRHHLLRNTGSFSHFASPHQQDSSFISSSYSLSGPPGRLCYSLFVSSLDSRLYALSPTSSH